MAVGVLDSELPEAPGRVVDLVVDPGASFLDLGVNSVGVIDPDVRVARLVDDLPVGNDPGGVVGES